jgi:hypothetical protein
MATLLLWKYNCMNDIFSLNVLIIRYGCRIVGKGLLVRVKFLISYDPSIHN